MVQGKVSLLFSRVPTNDNYIRYAAINIQYDNKTDQVSLAFENKLAKESKVQLLIEFQGVLNDHMSGFYRSSFKDKNGDTK